MLSHHRIRQLLVPLYSICIMVGLNRLKQARGVIWVLIFLVACCISLVPTPLLELRYFTPGVVIAALFRPFKVHIASYRIWNV